MIYFLNFPTFVLGDLTALWQGKIISTHTSLLPAFNVADPHKEVLQMKARITGCTVFFVEVDLDLNSQICVNFTIATLLTVK